MITLKRDVAYKKKMVMGKVCLFFQSCRAKNSSHFELWCGSIYDTASDVNPHGTSKGSGPVLCGGLKREMIIKDGHQR